MRLAAVLVLGACLAIFAGALPAGAAARAVPRGFYGMNWDGPVRELAPAVQEGEWGRMAAAGVESARAVFSWRRIAPARDGEPDWTSTDLVVGLAARHGVELLPVVLNTPEWARAYDHENAPPARPEYLATFLRELVQRYGTKGTFWTAHPELPRRPLRWWQVFNEPELYFRQDRKNLFPRYAKLIRASYGALRGADRRARLVLAGSFGFSWESLDRLYRLGIRGHFDAVAIHPYTSSAENVLRTVKLNRHVMRRHRDGRRQLWITELSFPASKRRAHTPKGLREVVTTDAGMAARLHDTYALLARKRRDRRAAVARVYWYTWTTAYRNKGYVFDYSGLVRRRGDEREPKRAFYAYRALARRHEGCIKTARARCR